MLRKEEVYMHIIAMFLIVGFTICYALIIILHPNVYTILRLLAVVVLIAAIYIALNRNTYLPFLGHTALPPILFKEEIVPHGATLTHVIPLENWKDGTIVIYWAAQTTKEGHQLNPTAAYGDYSNTGVTTVKGKKATLYFNCPDKYDVGHFKKTIDRHIHYRLMEPTSPIMSPVYTVYVKC